jgi:hypothetical protein
MRNAIALGCTGLILVLAAPVSAQFPTPVRPYTTVTPTTTTQTPAAEIAELQQQVAALQAAVTALQVKTQLVTSDGTSYSIAAPGNVSIQSQQNTTIKGGASASLTGAANVQISGAMVQINNGGRPAARASDPVSAGQIMSGSPTVLIGQ